MPPGQVRRAVNRRSWCPGCLARLKQKESLRGTQLNSDSDTRTFLVKVRTDIQAKKEDFPGGSATPSWPSFHCVHADMESPCWITARFLNTHVEQKDDILRNCAAALRSNTLQNLTLRYSELEDKDVRAIADALTLNTSLKNLGETQ
jgi:hypothetical protein